MEKEFERGRKMKVGEMRKRADQSELNRTQSLLDRRNRTHMSMASLKEV